MVKVVKFGGSSLASAEQFKKVGNIIRADEDRNLILDRKSTRLNSSHSRRSRMPSSA